MAMAWLPSQVEAEDWGTMAELQARLTERAERGHLAQWQAGIRAQWAREDAGIRH